MNSMLLTFPFNFPYIINVVADNELSGTIPTEVGLLTDFMDIILSKNFFPTLEHNRFVQWF